MQGGLVMLFAGTPPGNGRTPSIIDCLCGIGTLFMIFALLLTALLAPLTDCVYGCFGSLLTLFAHLFIISSILLLTCGLLGFCLYCLHFCLCL